MSANTGAVRECRPEEAMMMGASDIGWAAENIRQEATAVSGVMQSATGQVRDEWTRPTVLMRPRVYPDGDQWCALYGENIQEGVAGFGPTPEAACRDFDAHWLRGRHGRDHSEDLQESARQNADV